MASDSDMDCSTFSIGLDHKEASRNDGVSRRLDFDSQPYGDEDEEGACAKPPTDDTDARVFRASAFLKKAQQEAAATQAHVYGAEQAAIELSKLLSKRQAAVSAAAKRLKSLQAMRANASSATPSAAPETVKSLSKPKESKSAKGPKTLKSSKHSSKKPKTD